MGQQDKHKTFRILSLDGGGVRGLFPAFILRNINHYIGIDLPQAFQLIAGTSIGAIIGAGLALGKPIEQLISYAEKESRVVFTPNRHTLRGAAKSYYSTHALKEFIGKIVEDATFADLRTEILITALDIETGDPIVYSSAHNQTMRLASALLASCSAPLFFDPVHISQKLVADGGLWANNPALLAYGYAHKELGLSPERLKVLSLGTGNKDRYYSNVEGLGEWGVLRWRPMRLAYMMVEAQSKSQHQILSNLMPKDRYLRVTYSDDKLPALDDIQALSKLRGFAGEIFGEKVSELARFFRTE